MMSMGRTPLRIARSTMTSWRSTKSNVVLLSVLGLIGVATIIATVLLWPNGNARR